MSEVNDVEVWAGQQRLGQDSKTVYTALAHDDDEVWVSIEGEGTQILSMPTFLAMPRHFDVKELLAEIQDLKACGCELLEIYGRYVPMSELESEEVDIINATSRLFTNTRNGK